MLLQEPQLKINTLFLGCRLSKIYGMIDYSNLKHGFDKLPRLFQKT
jgi:hypothetical protein